MRYQNLPTFEKRKATSDSCNIIGSAEYVERIRKGRDSGGVDKSKNEWSIQRVESRPFVENCRKFEGDHEVAHNRDTK